MKKHVYQFNQYINATKLKNEIYPLIHNQQTMEQIQNQIICYLNIDFASLTKPQVSLEVIDEKKDLKAYLQSFLLDFSNQEQKEQKIQKLECVGINETNMDYKSLLSLIKSVLSNDTILEKIQQLNTYSCDKIQEIFKQYQLFPSESVLRHFVDLLNEITLNSMVDRKSNYQPMKRTKYYNENNNIVSKIVMERDMNLFSTITEFEGEIYESLSFQNDEEAKQYQLEHNIEEDLLEDVVSVLHFHSESTLNDWYNDLTIVKYRMGCIYINYGERLFIQNKKNNCSITAEEIDAIIAEFEYRDINNEFIKYVVHELQQFKNSLLGKSDRRVVEALPPYEQDMVVLRSFMKKRNDSLKTSDRILKNDQYGDDKTIYLKIKVISDTPITFEKTPSFVLK